jgi:hypothetical protein
VSSDGAGGFLIADTDNQRIRRVDASGIITTFAGNGTQGFFGDGGPATQAWLNNPSGVTSDGTGGFLIADAFNNRIRRVDASGIITTVAGNSSQGFSGDGGPATQASLRYPSAVASDGAGGFLIADNNRIRRVDANGMITTVAGNGQHGFSGDSGFATQAELNGPSGVISDGTGGFLIADTGNSRIRRVDASGTITTVAGNGLGGYSGDGGPATQAQLAYPTGISPDGVGGFLIADSSNNRVRRVDASGIITTVAGNDDSGFSGDGGPATQAQLYYPAGVASDGEGGFFIADYYNNRIRRVFNAGFLNPSTVYGDINGDGSVTNADVVLLLQYYLGLATLTSDRLKASDVRPKPGANGADFGDGKINGDDLNAVLRASIGLISLP